MLGQFLHVFSLNELVDISKIYAKELSRIRGISPANLNTFSNANRTRNPSVMEKFFWMMYDHFKSQDETFIKAKHKGKLSRFKLRNIYAIDSTTIKLAYWCIKWAKHRQRKAVKPLASLHPRFDHCECCQCENVANTNVTNCQLDFREDVRYVGFVECGEAKALLAEVFQRCADKIKLLAVYDEETIVERHSFNTFVAH